MDMLQHGITMITGFGECRVRVGAEQHGIGSIDTDDAQLAQSLSDGVRVMTNIGRESHDWVAGSLTDPLDASRSIALENGSVFGKRHLPGGVFHRLPVGVV